MKAEERRKCTVRARDANNDSALSAASLRVACCVLHVACWVFTPQWARSPA